MNMSESSPRIAQALLGDVHRALGGELRGDAALVIEGIRPLLQAGPSDISFLAHERYASQLAETRAGAVIVSPAMADKAEAPGRHLIVIEQPYVAFARLTQWWAARRRRPAVSGVHPSAVIDPSAVTMIRDWTRSSYGTGFSYFLSERIPLSPDAEIASDQVSDLVARIQEEWLQ
jgi:hypothetical protein